MQLGTKTLILAQLVIVQEAKAVPKAEELSACFGLRELSGAVSAPYTLKRSSEEQSGMKEGVVIRTVSIYNELECLAIPVAYFHT